MRKFIIEVTDSNELRQNDTFREYEMDIIQELSSCWHLWDNITVTEVGENGEVYHRIKKHM